MLIRRRRKKCINWRNFLQSMAVLTMLSALLLLCSVSVLMTPASQSDNSQRKNEKSSETSRRVGERILQYIGTETVSVRLNRHNRMLQFMDSTSFENNVPKNNAALEHRNNTPQILFSDLKIKNKLKINKSKKKRTGSRLLSPSRVNSSLHGVHKPILSPQRTSVKLRPTSPSEHFVSESNFTENMDRQLDNTDYIISGNNSESRLNLTFNDGQAKRLPKAIIIGVKKSGTRALLEFLRMHPNVEGTGPEPHFFDRNYEKGLQWYRDLMPRTKDYQVTVEKTPGYFVTRDAPKRIFDMDPAIKLILVVRDPVTRAISDYCQAVSKHAMKPFENMALLDERLGLVNTSWGAIKIGVYTKHMERWLQVFPLSQIHLVDGQMLIEEPAREVAKVETFLGLPKFIKDSHFYLRGFKGTFPCLIRGGKPHCLDEKTKGRDHPVVKESVLQRLRDFYRPFNAKFFQMVDRNFDWS